MTKRLGMAVFVALWACTPADQQPPSVDATGSSTRTEPRPAVPNGGMAALSAQVDEDRSTALVRATSRVAPAVVSISVLRTQTVRARTLWERMMLPPGAQRQSAGFGSGVIVRADGSDGIVLTNDHVITGADRIQVTLPDGRDAPAEVVGSDPVADVAVLRISADRLPVAPVGTAAGLLIGEWAIAIGNPLGTAVGDVQPTVTAGVISGVNRNITPSSEDEGFYFGMIQTDAAINPGNSGGALVNAAGEVIGINASILSRSGGSEGLGFAIPIDRAMRIADDLVEHGEVRRGWVGIEVMPVVADEFGRRRGVRVSRVAPGSPADQAGIEPEDLLLLANRRILAGPLDWEGVLLDLGAGEELALDVFGDQQRVTLMATAFPSMTAERISVLRDIELITVTPQIQAELGVSSAAGAAIASISTELRNRLGLQPDDVIVQINRRPVRTAGEVQRAFEILAGSGLVQLVIERDGGLMVRNFTWR